jgi:hypothetical protein
MIVAVTILILGLAGAALSWYVERHERRLNPATRAPRAPLPAAIVHRDVKPIERHQYPICPYCGQRHDPNLLALCRAHHAQQHISCPLCGQHHDPTLYDRPVEAALWHMQDAQRLMSQTPPGINGDQAQRALARLHRASGVPVVRPPPTARPGPGEPMSE